MSCDVGEAMESLENGLLLRHRIFTYSTWRAAHGRPPQDYSFHANSSEWPMDNFEIRSLYAVNDVYGLNGDI